MKEIKLTGKRGGVALVDDEDYERLSQFKWNHLHVGYAGRSVMVDKKKSMVYMHIFIMGDTGFPEVDHKDGNKLNNQRSNLRPCTRSTNATNSGKRYPRGGYGRNVAKMKRGGERPFHVMCWKDGKPVSGGYYATVEEAQAKAAELRKELGYVD